MPQKEKGHFHSFHLQTSQMIKRPAWMVISPLWSTLAFFCCVCAWPIFQTLLVSDPVEFHHVFEGLVLSLMQPQNVSNMHLNQHDFFLPLRGCIKKSPVFRDNLLRSRSVNNDILSPCRGLTSPSGRGF